MTLYLLSDPGNNFTDVSMLQHGVGELIFEEEIPVQELGGQTGEDLVLGQYGIHMYMYVYNHVAKEGPWMMWFTLGSKQDVEQHKKQYIHTCTFATLWALHN